MTVNKKIKILLAPNSFKECASSNKINELLKNNLSNKNFDLIPFPLSDGGDGFLEVCKYHFNLDILNIKASTPYDETLIDVPIGYKKDTQTIYIESAKVLGLHLIPIELRRPIELNSKGMGDLLNLIQYKSETSKLKVKKVIIGVGGTGTNDLGIGMCSQLGLKLYDDFEREINPDPINFRKVKRVKWQQKRFDFNIEVVIDVDNLLLGKNGATYVFGKQKGSTEDELIQIESGFKNLIKLFINNDLLDSTKKLSGAAGGLAAGFQIFFNSKITSSKDFILKELKLASFGNINVIITGEGAFDIQSFMNKAPGIIIDFFKNSSKKIIIIAGYYAPEIKGELPKNCEIIELSSFFNSKEESIKHFEKGLILASEKIKKLLLN